MPRQVFGSWSTMKLPRQMRRDSAGRHSFKLCMTSALLSKKVYSRPTHVFLNCALKAFRSNSVAKNLCTFRCNNLSIALVQKIRQVTRSRPSSGRRVCSFHSAFPQVHHRERRASGRRESLAPQGHDIAVLFGDRLQLNVVLRDGWPRMDRWKSNSHSISRSHEPSKSWCRGVVSQFDCGIIGVLSGFHSLPLWQHRG